MSTTQIDLTVEAVRDIHEVLGRRIVDLAVDLNDDDPRLEDLDKLRAVANLLFWGRLGMPGWPVELDEDGVAATLEGADLDLVVEQARWEDVTADRRADGSEWMGEELFDREGLLAYWSLRQQRAVRVLEYLGFERGNPTKLRIAAARDARGDS